MLAVAEVLERDAAATRLAEPDDYVQPAIRDASGTLVGTMYFRLASVDDRTAEIGWALLPRAQGRGYAREAAALLLFDYKKRMENPKLIPHFGGYYGKDGDRMVFVFAKGSWVAGVAGLPEKDADLAARELAARLN